MRKLLLLLFVVLFGFVLSPRVVRAQLPTFGPICDDATPVPTAIPSATPTSPPNQPTYTPAPTSTPIPTKIPCSPTVPPTVPPFVPAQGGVIPTKAPLPTRQPTPPRSGTIETTVVFLGLAGLLLFGGSLGLFSSVKDK